MPNSDKHLISNSSALSKPITPVSSPSQKLVLSQLVCTGAASAGYGGTQWASGEAWSPGPPPTLHQGCEWLIQPFLPLPTLAGQSREENGLDRITGWDNIVLFISTLHACCKNDCSRGVLAVLLVVTTANFSALRKSVMWILGGLVDTLFGWQVISAQCRAKTAQKGLLRRNKLDRIIRLASTVLVCIYTDEP